MNQRLLLAALFVGALGCDTTEPDESAESVYTDYHTIVMADDGFKVARTPESDPVRDADLDVNDYTANTETAAGCWVVLQWCDAPGPDGAVCTFTNCTIGQAISACQSLIDQTC